MRSVLIIGLGRFGRHLAANFASLGNEVMVVDKDENSVNPLAPAVTAAQIGDCTDEAVLREIGVSDFDICFVCITENLETSMIVTMTLKELGAKQVITKVNQDIHVKFLLSNGADNIIYPERDMAFRTAMKYSARGAYDYLQLSPSYGIFEVAPPADWVGKTLREAGIRKKYQLNIIAEKTGDTITPIDQEDFVFTPEQHLLICGDKKSFQKLMGK